MKFHFLGQWKPLGHILRNYSKHLVLLTTFQTQKLAQAWNLTCWIHRRPWVSKGNSHPMSSSDFCCSFFWFQSLPDGIKWYLTIPWILFSGIRVPWCLLKGMSLPCWDKAASPEALVRMLLRPTPARDHRSCYLAAVPGSPGPKQWGSYSCLHSSPGKLFLQFLSPQGSDMRLWGRGEEPEPVTQSTSFSVISFTWKPALSSLVLRDKTSYKPVLGPAPWFTACAWYVWIPWSRRSHCRWGSLSLCRHWLAWFAAWNLEAAGMEHLALTVLCTSSLLAPAFAFRRRGSSQG